MSETTTGTRNENQNAGLTGAQREAILERDGHICQDCGVFVGGRFESLPTANVHHIDGDPENNDPKNLTTLCIDCHNERHDHYIPDGPDDRFDTAHYGQDHPHWSGGRYTTTGGYICVKRPDHPDSDVRGYILEHRLVAEEKSGRRLDDNELVHHINEDRADNRPENLEVLTKAEHMARHRSEDSKLREPDEPNPEIECACGCGQTFKKYDDDNRPREYVVGHQGREQEAPTQQAILDLLEKHGPMKRAWIINETGRTGYGITSASKELKKKGKIENANLQGYWKLPHQDGSVSQEKKDRFKNGLDSGGDDQ